MSVHPQAQIHPNAVVEHGATIGARTRVWAFAHVLPGAVIGTDCNICDHVFIENDVHVGDRVTVKCGVQLWDGNILEDDVFVGSNATFTNDSFPRSKQYPDEFLQTIVKKGASVGANATLLPGITVGECAMVGAGAVVLHDVPPMAVAVGNPAQIKGYVDTQRIETRTANGAIARVTGLSVARAGLVELKEVDDLRGKLAVIEAGHGLSFLPKRVFFIYDVPNREVRGEHAHRYLEELVICVHGEVNVVVDDGHARREVSLNRPTLGLYIGPLVWRSWFRYSRDAVLLVLASDAYDPDDYIRDYESFLKMVRVADGRMAVTDD
jgi:acetyltransferase-like isoleucine patch superfamily enzyme